MSSISPNVTLYIVAGFIKFSHIILYVYCIEVLFASSFLQFDPEKRKNAREIVDLLLPIKKAVMSS